jgi:DNA-binding transcriptional ArsR family regulator
LLAAPERRLILSVLRERDGGPVTLDSLARAVRDRLADSDRDRSPTKHDLRVSFHHVHLPKLADAGVVEYDDEAVRLLPDPLVDQLTAAERGRELG